MRRGVNDDPGLSGQSLGGLRRVLRLYPELDWNSSPYTAFETLLWFEPFT